MIRYYTIINSLTFVLIFNLTKLLKFTIIVIIKKEKEENNKLNERSRIVNMMEKDMNNMNNEILGNKSNSQRLNKIYLIDGNSLMFRSYYATFYTGNLMRTKDGLYTNALFGFCNMITKLLDLQGQNVYAFVAFDAGKQTFRHKQYDEYKGTRKPLPNELRMQIPLIKEYLDLINVKRLESLDYEADDLLATASRIFENDFEELVVVTGDHDLLQLVNDRISVALTKKGVGDLDIYTKDNFFEKAGMNPDQIVEYKGIVGDVSDNLPGIKGIGEKTALKLLNDYKNIEGIYEHLDSLTTRVRNLFIEGKDIALKCRYLATLERNAKIELSLDDVLVKKPHLTELINFYTKMEFNAFLKKIKIEEPENEQSDVEISKELLLDDNCYLVYETVGQNYSKDEFLGIGLLINDRNYFLKPDDLKNKDIKDYFENPKYFKYTYDYKGLYFILSKYGIEIKNVIFDLLIASYLINPVYANDDFKVTYDNYENSDVPYYQNIYGANTKIHTPNENVYISYSLNKCKALKKIKDKVFDLLIDNEMEYLMKIEMDLSRVLAKMELQGLRIDMNKLDEIGVRLSLKAEESKKKVFLLAGEEFNLNSPKQLGDILFDKLSFPHGKKNKNGYSTSVDVLEKLGTQYEIVKDILDYRALSKLVSTYVNGLKEVTHDEFIHPLYKQTLTNTGRLSSVEPNIQNMPIRTETGQVIREVFISRFENGVIVSADYSQIELRVLAHMSADPKMIEAFKSHVDFHTKTASEIFEVNVENVTKEMRRAAKAINFGIIYGMSPWGLSESLGISTNEANRFISKYFYNYQKAKECLDKFISDAYLLGYSKTLLGRRRYIPELKNPNGQIRSFGERTAMNSPIQGTAADIIKLAMNKVQAKMDEEKMESIMIAQVHDELVFDCPENEANKMIEIVKNVMENAIKLDVPLEVGIASGKNWFEAK